MYSSDEHPSDSPGWNHDWFDGSPFPLSDTNFSPPHLTQGSQISGGYRPYPVTYKMPSMGNTGGHPNTTRRERLDATVVPNSGGRFRQPRRSWCLCSYPWQCWWPQRPYPVHSAQDGEDIRCICRALQRCGGRHEPKRRQGLVPRHSPIQCLPTGWISGAHWEYGAQCRRKSQRRNPKVPWVLPRGTTVSRERHQRGRHHHDRHVDLPNNALQTIQASQHLAEGVSSSDVLPKFHVNKVIFLFWEVLS